MGLATHLGPWLLGTVKDTTGTTAGTLRNLGATVVGQPVTINMSGVAKTSGATAQYLCTVPAGSKILRFNVEVVTTVAGNSVSQVGVVIGNGTSTNNQLVTTFNTGTAVTKVAQSTVDTATQVALTNNVGTSDYLIYATFTATTGNPTSGAIVITPEYIVRLNDGTYLPASA